MSIAVSPGLRRLASSFVVLAVLTASCSRAVPQERFAEAFAATLADSFSFEVLLEADQGALADLGEMAGGAAALLSGIRLRGIVDGPDTQLALDALGGTVVELRQLGDPESPQAAFFLRAGIVDLLAQVGVDEFEAEAAVHDRLVGAGAAPDVLAAVTAGFAGEWVGVRGRLSRALDAVTPAAGGTAPAGGEDAATTVFGTDLESFLERYVDVSELDDGVLHLDLRFGDLLRAVAGLGSRLDVGRAVVTDRLDSELADLPILVPGDVRVVDGVVEELAFDVATAVRGLGRPVDGRVVVRVLIREHATAGPVLAPDGVEPLDSAVLDEAVVAILSALGIG